MLVRIRARPDTLHLSHGRTVMATGRDGCIAPGSEHGLFVHETRLVSTLRYFVDGQAPVPNVLSNVEQDSFLGYYLLAAPGVDLGERDAGSGMVPSESRQPLELRISRTAGNGLHEDVDFTNYARAATSFTFVIEIETDCSDLADLSRRVDIDRRVDVGFSRPPRFEGNLATFEIELEPHQSWRLCIDFAPTIDGVPMRPPKCRRAGVPPAVTPAPSRTSTCEEQGFVYIAKLHFAETLFSLGMHDDAQRLFDESVALRKRFNEAFWMEDEGYYALALDADGKQVRSIASNAGHCIATGIADAEHVPRVVERMFRDDLFSGWGIRTLSSSHPAYNPYSYHLGSVWPVEQGTFALGFMRYGLHDRAQQLARAQFEAAALFDFHRLPELFSGHPRDAAHPFPALYPTANSPQAWSASTTFSLLQSMLGLYPYAPLKLLLVDPHLPEWLPEVTIRDLRVGEGRVTIGFHERTWKVLENEGTVHIVQQPMPWSLTATRTERLVDLMRSLVK